MMIFHRYIRLPEGKMFNLGLSANRHLLITVNINFPIHFLFIFVISDAPIVTNKRFVHRPPT